MAGCRGLWGGPPHLTKPYDFFWLSSSRSCDRCKLRPNSTAIARQNGRQIVCACVLVWVWKRPSPPLPPSPTSPHSTSSSSPPPSFLPSSAPAILGHHGPVQQAIFSVIAGRSSCGAAVMLTGISVTLELNAQYLRRLVPLSVLLC